MTWKTAVAGVPFGGAKGGVNCPADQLERAEVQKITRSFMDKVEKVLGPTRDIPAPDVNTNAQVMAWMMDEYGKLHGHTPAICTGKPIALEGSYGREAATGPRLRLHVPRGGARIWASARPTPPSSSRDSATSVPGRRGSCSSSAPRWSPSPTPTGRSAPTTESTPTRFTTTSHGGGLITEFEGAEAIDPDDLVAVPCDVFIPAALGGMIHEGNAGRMDCKVILEGANSPTTPAADQILRDKDVYIIPDVMANAGGVVVSYFEWVQNLQHFRWDEREVNDKLGTIMRRAYREVSARAREQGIDLREASYLVGIERVVEAAADPRLHLKALSGLEVEVLRLALLEPELVVLGRVLQELRRVRQDVLVLLVTLVLFVGLML